MQFRHKVSKSMYPSKPIQANIPALRKANLYNEFVLWSAMPPVERVRLGIEHQRDFAEYYQLEESTLSRWKRRADFRDCVREILKSWAFDRTPDVVQAIYRSALKGSSDSQRMWLQYFEGWSEKQTVQHSVVAQMTPRDIRFVIQGMPDPYKDKFYGYIREIIDTAVALREKGELQDGYIEEIAEEEAVLDQADNNTLDVLAQPASKVPVNHPHSISAGTVLAVSSRHYQSPERWL